VKTVSDKVVRLVCRLSIPV